MDGTSAASGRFRFAQPPPSDVAAASGAQAAAAPSAPASSVQPPAASSASDSWLDEKHQAPGAVQEIDVLRTAAAEHEVATRHSSASASSPSCEKGRDARIALPTLDAEQNRTASHQSIYLAEDDLQLELDFFFRPTWRRVLWWLACIASAGVVFLWHFYSPRSWARFNCEPIDLTDEKQRNRKGGKVWIGIKTRHEPVALVQPQYSTLPTPVSRSWIFPPSLLLPAVSASAFASGEKRPCADDAPDSDAPVDHVTLLNYRSTTLLLSPRGFVPIGSWRDQGWNSRSSVERGLTEEQAKGVRAFIFGRNEVEVEIKGWGRLTVDEALHPFYIFSLCSIALWSYDEYQWYALVIGIISLVGIGASVITTRRALVRLQAQSRYECTVRVLRSSASEPAEERWVETSSVGLVPGDVIDLSASGDGKLDLLPCDCVLLEGEMIAGEAMLTGESVPVVKTACPNAAFADVLAAAEPLAKLDKHIAWGGTKLIRSRPGPSGTTRALVVQTGFNTAKGSVVRLVLFPKPLQHNFYGDAFRFIGILCVIAVLGFVGSLVRFIQLGVDRTEIALRALDLFTITIPPALPAAMSVCTTLAIARLRRAAIFCTSPQRINVAGKVSVCVFDKTGTITEAGLDVQGVRTVGPDGTFAKLCSTIEENEQLKTDDRAATDLTEALMSAHDLNMLEGEMIGEPIEVTMFAWAAGANGSLDDEGTEVDLQSDGRSQGTALDSDGVVARVPLVHMPDGSKRAVVAKHDFVSALRRMSVIVKAENDLGGRAYTKGAPEAVMPLCNAASLPSDYVATLDHYTHRGFRVLAIAGKELPSLGWADARQMARSTVESDLTFLGLIIFENKLKAGSHAALDSLHQAGIPTKICTGDNPLTAIAVAREANVIPAGAPVYVARISGASASDAKGAAQGELEWADVNSEHAMLDSYSLRPRSEGLRLADCGLAMTGETFAHLLQHSAQETIERALVHAQIFARFSPEQKQQLCEQLQALQYTVAFTGDGANDCGALRAADVGLSLSEAEASVAAPFTSRDEDIECICHLLREGRNSITTSFNLFSWMLIYSLSEYWTVLLLYTVATSLSNAEYLYIDVCIVLPIAIGMASNRPADRLARSAPPSRLMSRRVVLSVLSQMILLLLAQATTYLLLHKRSTYESPLLDPDNLELSSQDNTALFKQSTFTYIIAAICWSYGPPHRKPIWNNFILAASIVVLTAFNLAFLFINSEGPFFNLFGYHVLERPFLGIIFGVVLIQGSLAFLSEALLVDRAARLLERPVRAVRARARQSRGKPFLYEGVKTHRRVRAAIDNE